MIASVIVNRRRHLWRLYVERKCMNKKIWIIPAVVLGLSIVLRFASGPFWLGLNNDPAYLYLINSLYVMEHQAPFFIQHPGTPVMLLGGLVIKLLHPFMSMEGMIKAVVAAPEWHLHMMYALLLLLYIGSLLWIGVCALKRTGSMVYALLTQVPGLLYLTMYHGMGTFLAIPANVCAETLQITLMNVFLVFVIDEFFGKSSVRRALLLGFVAGVLMATKVTAMAVLVLPLMILSTWRARFAYVASIVVGFVIFTQPVWSRYPLIFAWLKSLVVYTGFHATGSATFINWSNYAAAFARLIATNWLVSIVLFASIVTVLRRAFFEKTLTVDERRLCALAITTFLHIIVVGKQASEQYMIPGIALSGLLAAQLFWVLKDRIPAFLNIERGVAILGVGCVIMSFVYIGNYYKDSRVMMGLSQKVYSQYNNCIVAGYYRSSSPVFGLQFGDENYGLRRYGQYIQQQYSQHFGMNYWEKNFDDSLKRIYFEDLQAMNPCVVIYGQTLGSDFMAEDILALEPLETAGIESVYRVHGSHFKQVDEILMMAKQMFIQGDLEKAYFLAMKAKEYHHHAADGFIEQIKAAVAYVQSQQQKK